MKWNPFNTKIGVSLGGGGAKGIAHIGVLKAFEEENVKISYISGTSVGALLASYYAFGKSIDEIWDVAKDLTLQKVLSIGFQKHGLFNTKDIKEMILRDLGEVRIEDAKIPLAICTTDIISGEQVIYTNGDLATIVCASVAIPGVFNPVEYEGRILVDGGISENVPITILDDMGAGIVVGINLNGVEKYRRPKDIIGVISNSINICMNMNTRQQLREADIVLNLDLSHYNFLDNRGENEKLLNEGYRPMKKKIHRLLWFKRTNYLRYLYKVVRQLIPLRIPKVFKKKIEYVLKN
jgi:NTE family protein